MKTHIEKALDYVRKYVDMSYIKRCIVRAMEQGCPFSISFPTSTDEITDLLEEYGQDNDLPEGWWCEYGDIDDIVEQL
jgi:hypothetical protein